MEILLTSRMIILLLLPVLLLTGCMNSPVNTPATTVDGQGEQQGLFVQDEDYSLKDSTDQINYSIGFQIGNDFQRQKVEMRREAMLRGIQDAMQNDKALMTKGEMKTLLLELKQRIVEEQSAAIENYRAEDRIFLEENARRPGILVLDSGLQYKVVRPGNGASPEPTDWVRIHYLGTKVDGDEFGSTYRENQPAEFSLEKVIPGFKEALPLMSEGAKWVLYIPADLAFGERGPLAERAVIFEIELLKVLEGPSAK